MMRQAWIDKDATATVALTRQCVLAGVSRATVYARQRPRPLDQHDEMLKRLIDQEYSVPPANLLEFLGNCGEFGVTMR
jgi:putative transposase